MLKLPDRKLVLEAFRTLRRLLTGRRERPADPAPPPARPAPPPPPPRPRDDDDRLN